MARRRQAKVDRPILRFTALLALAGFFSFAMVGQAVLADRFLGLGDDFRPEVQLPLLLVSGLIALLIALATLVAAFHLFDLTDPDKPFGVPEGTLQAVIALTIILIFAITSLFLRGSLNAEVVTVEGLTEQQVAAIPGDEILRREEAADGLFEVDRRVTADEDAKDFSNQLLTILGTLVGAVAGFYFGAKSVETGVTAGGGPAPPTNTSPPVITGNPRGGETLRAEPGGWTGSPNFGHQWQRKAPDDDEWADIKGANLPTYVIAHDDREKAIRVAVTATNAAGAQAAYSAPTETIRGQPPTLIDSPRIEGESHEGAVLRALPGKWAGWPEPVPTYQWERSRTGKDPWAPITGAEASTYSLGREDVGKRLRVRVTATNDVGSNTALSSPTEEIAQPPTPAAATS